MTIHKWGLLLAIHFSTANTLRGEEMHVPVLLKLEEQIELASSDAGLLQSVSVKEGDLVTAGAVVAQLDEREALLDLKHAQVQLGAARKQAENDVKVRYAKKAHEVAEAELNRALSADKRMTQSVTQTELDQLRLTAEKTALEIEQAQLELELAKQAALLREVDVESAEVVLHKRRVVAPFAGMVAQVMRHGGEWVQPGQTTARLLRLDKVRAEGLVSAKIADGRWLGRGVVLQVELRGKLAEIPGKIVFVSPEVDPVSEQIRLFAEFPNQDFALRPGQKGELLIDREALTAEGR
jgi:macrolide-specific efflux system membrane fusion protein